MYVYTSIYDETLLLDKECKRMLRRTSRKQLIDEVLTTLFKKDKINNDYINNSKNNDSIFDEITTNNISGNNISENNISENNIDNINTTKNIVNDKNVFADFYKSILILLGCHKELM